MFENACAVRKIRTAQAQQEAYSLRKSAGARRSGAVFAAASKPACAHHRYCPTRDSAPGSGVRTGFGLIVGPKTPLTLAV